MASLLATGGSRYFYPRSPCGERHTPIKAYNIIKGFLSTLSLRRATETLIILPKEFDNFYPRSPCGERPPNIFRHCTTYLFLSTLSLRRATIQTLILHMERLFLSTLSLRRATFANFEGFFWWVISIHALLAESDTGGQSCNSTLVHFYPRSPCGERLARLASRSRSYSFLSTLSLRRAT